MHSREAELKTKLWLKLGTVLYISSKSLHQMATPEEGCFKAFTGISIVA